MSENRLQRGRSLAILTQQISHYHAARFRAARAALENLTVISAMNGADYDEFLSNDVSGLDVVRLFDGRISYFASVTGGEVWIATQTALNRLGPKVVAVAGWSSPESVSAIWWARQNNAHIIMMSESQERDSSRNRLREAIKSRIVRACDAALVGGRQQVDYIVRLGMPRDHVFQGYDAVDNLYFSEGADRARADATRLRKIHALPERYLLAVARFVPKKNLGALVLAFSHALERTRTPHTLIIVGDGPGRAELEEKIGRSGLEARVKLVGYKDYSTLPIFYGLAEALVHVSLSEQWGLVINEGAAAALPIIVSRTCGAAAELVQPGLNGRLIEPTDVENMSRAMQQLMLAPLSKREAMGRESRRVVADWGLEKFAVGLSQAAESAAGREPRRLGVVDGCLLRLLSRRYFSAVS